MTKQYISDIITEEEIRKWQKGNRILISSQTGSGKSEFIKNNLYNYCKATHQKILLMSNRILLKKQNEHDLKNKKDIITLQNYQALEYQILNGIQDIMTLFEPYDYIAMDEGHYPFADSCFNENTNLLIYPIKETPKDKIFLFLTATPEALLDYQPNFDFRYNISKDYSYIKNIYFYDRNSKISSNGLESIINSIPNNEKILYFGSNVDDIYDLSTKFKDATFICSPGNKLADKSDNSVMEEIAEKSMFSSRILFATKVLDNGVNIIDRNLKHIIIDTLDPISFIQTLGRKRNIDENDCINLYVKNYHKGQIYFVLQSVYKKIRDIKDASKTLVIELEKKYPEYDFERIIEENYISNVSLYQHYFTQRKILETLQKSKYEDAYARYICKLLDKDIRYAKDAFLEFEKTSLKDLLEKYINVKMFKDNQEIFKNMFFRTIFTTKRTNYESRALNAINKIIQEDYLKFKVESRRETKGNNKGKYYWIIERIIQ